MGPLYVGAQNDCLFIIDQPPRPSTDDIVPDRGVNVIAKIEPGLVPRAAEYAQLFAVAPDLLAACEAALVILAAYIPAEAWDGHCDQVARLLRDALKRAKGE